MGSRAPPPIDVSLASAEPAAGALSDLEDERRHLADQGVDETYDQLKRRPLVLPPGHFSVLPLVDSISLEPITLATCSSLGLTPFYVSSTDQRPIGWLEASVVEAIEVDIAKLTAIKVRPSFVVLEGRVAFSDDCNEGGSEARTEHIDRLVRNWKQQGIFASELKGWRDEKYSIWSAKSPTASPLPGSNVAFFCERAACSLFGFATFGVHMTGYVVDERGEYSIWVARRSKTKQTWPGLLDNTVAGGISARATPLETMVRECDEEASLDSEFVLDRLRAAGVVTYTTKTRDGLWWQPECQYIFDLRFDHPSTPGAVIPRTNDEEVQSFELLSERQCLESALNGEWKPNCALVLIDFLIRHGRLSAEADSSFAEVCVALRRGIGGLPMPA